MMICNKTICFESALRLLLICLKHFHIILFHTFSHQFSIFKLLVLKYVQNKDVFMRYHKAHLTRRLILETSVDNEIEENMVDWLRVCYHLYFNEVSMSDSLVIL